MALLRNNATYPTGNRSVWWTAFNAVGSGLPETTADRLASNISGLFNVIAKSLNKEDLRQIGKLDVTDSDLVVNEKSQVNGEVHFNFSNPGNHLVHSVPTGSAKVLKTQYEAEANSGAFQLTVRELLGSVNLTTDQLRPVAGIGKTK